ncbi:hypothetical protein PQX77_006914 [Marasmius sp. AFHP31]|nr:hypothetical protein PQX77_006914 [Marasmius sp. AFHP31]
MPCVHQDLREASRRATLAKRAVTVQRKKGQGTAVPVDPLPTLPAEQTERTLKVIMPFSKREDTESADAVPEKDEAQAKKEAWEEIMKRVERNDDGMEKGWKEDIDTLLVFAGLFSAVVTAFTIESYQWLSEDPSDQSVAILSHISAQLNDRNVSSFDAPQFTPDPSLVRINTFWFLSLILALVDALFGLMCKQWLREFRRPTNTRTPEQWLSLRCFKAESFERWHVPSFLAALPIILEVALFCFFAGLLELLWTKHKVPFAIAAAVIGSAVAFYIATTILPGMNIIWLLFRVHPQNYTFKWVEPDKRVNRIPKMDYLCPYKSPQAWATFKVLAWIFNPSFPLSRHVIFHYLKRKFYKDESDVPEECVLSVSNRSRPKSWFSVDLDIIQRFSRILSCPDMYKMRAHRWLVQEFRDSPLMAPHLRTLIHALPPEVVMPTVFDCVMVRADRDWEARDMEAALDGWNPPKHFMAPFTYSRSHIQAIYYHHHWIRSGSPITNDLSTQPFSWDEHNPLSWVERCGPLTRIVKLMLDQGPLAIEYVKNFGCHYGDIKTVFFNFKPAIPGIISLAKMDLRLFVDKQPVVDLLIWFNKEVDYRYFDDPYTLIDALDILRVSHGLFFTRRSGYFPSSMARLNDLLCDSSTKKFALELMGDFQRAYQDDIPGGCTPRLLAHLVLYLFGNVPNDLEKYPPHLQRELNRPDFLRASKSSARDVEIPYLLTSQEGLSFLRSLNVIIHEHWDASLMTAIEGWVVGLKCVAHLNNLPLDYFAVHNTQHPPGSSGAGSAGTASNLPPDDGAAVDGGNGLTGSRREYYSAPIGPSTSTEEETRDAMSVGLFESGEAEYNADILERHLFDYLIPT